jgi:tetratricopeptide (TPR) repeat protein
VTPAQRDQKETAAFHLSRGRTFAEARRDREAVEELRRAIYLAPYEDEPHLLLGKIYLRTGRMPEAVDEFKVALWSRETAAAHVALGAALPEQGDKPPHAGGRACTRDGANLADATFAGSATESPCQHQPNRMPDQPVREIQRSGKQLVFLFMASGPAVAIFLLGISVGRGVHTAADGTTTATDVAVAGVT